MRAVHFCESCGKVQPPAPVDYFTFFGTIGLFFALLFLFLRFLPLISIFEMRELVSETQQKAEGKA